MMLSLNKNWIKKLLLVVVCVSSAAVSHASSDTLVLNNGMRLVGKIKKIDIGKIDFDIDDLSLQSVKMNKVKTFSATSNLFRIQTTNKQIYFSKVYSDSTPGRVKIVLSDSTFKVISIREITSMSYFSQSVKNSFEGALSLGYSYTKSSDIGRFNFDGTAKYLMPKSDLMLTSNFIATQTNNVLNRDRENISLSASRYFNSVLIGIVVLSYQRNLELGLARRFQEGVGIGIHYLNALRLRGTAYSGFLINQEKSTEGFRNGVQAEIPFIIKFDYFKFSKPDITLSSTLNMYVSLTQSGRFRQEMDIRLKWKIIGDFSTNLQLYNNYDNQPPGLNSNNFDYGIVLGLGYTF